MGWIHVKKHRESKFLPSLHETRDKHRRGRFTENIANIKSDTGLQSAAREALEIADKPKPVC
jgi:hypothetical protein